VLTGAAPTGGEQAPMSRRGLLAASAALPLLLTACKGVQALGTPPPPAPDIVVLRSAISAEQVMLARYAAALAQFKVGMPPDGTPTDIALFTAILTVQAEHAAHLAQLKSRLVEPAGSSPSPSPHASPTVPVAGTIAAGLTMLEQAEQAASDRLIGQLDRLPPSLAQLFASIAASEATHVPLLQALQVPQ
jgi:Ferritin-like domain